MRFQRATQRRFGLTPRAKDNTDAHVVKIRAKWSPQNMYVIDGKALSLDGFVLPLRYPREGIYLSNPTIRLSQN
jgi:hypothetical protein